MVQLAGLSHLNRLCCFNFKLFKSPICVDLIITFAVAPQRDVYHGAFVVNALAHYTHTVLEHAVFQCAVSKAL